MTSRSCLQMVEFLQQSCWNFSSHLLLITRFFSTIWVQTLFILISLARISYSFTIRVQLCCLLNDHFSSFESLSTSGTVLEVFGWLYLLLSIMSSHLSYNHFTHKNLWSTVLKPLNPHKNLCYTYFSLVCQLYQM